MRFEKYRKIDGDIDHYYTQVNGKWARPFERAVNGQWKLIPDDERPEITEDYWVDIAHGRSFTDELFFFPDLASAVHSYVVGWMEWQYVYDDGKTYGLDHSYLYSRGRLIHKHGLDAGDALPKWLVGNRRKYLEVLGEIRDHEEDD